MMRENMVGVLNGVYWIGGTQFAEWKGLRFYSIFSDQVIESKILPDLTYSSLMPGTESKAKVFIFIPLWCIASPAECIVQVFIKIGPVRPLKILYLDFSRLKIYEIDKFRKLQNDLKLWLQISTKHSVLHGLCMEGVSRGWQSA